MYTPQICPGVFYTGVNDRTKHKFENLWALPYGVSYNSYIVRGEKIAIMDGVEFAGVDELLRNIATAEQGVKPDYIIVHHMEPDHSGALPTLLEKYPEMKVVTNAKAIDMIKGFYHIDDADRFICVKDGDTLDLGDGFQFKFYMTPMVHWPETMMTWLEKGGVLFSGDGFGTFGALDGGVMDSDFGQEMLDIYFHEMRRYYSAIVGKYGVPVQNALRKLSGLPINYLCTLHGPVWHAQACKVIGIYDALSSFKAENGVVIAYGSMYGNTMSLVEHFARALKSAGVQNVVVHNMSKSEMSDVLADIWHYNGLVLASPTYNMSIFPPVEALVKALEVRELKDRHVAVLGSYAWAPQAAKLLKERVEGMQLDLVGEPVAMKMSLTSQTLEAATTLAQALAQKVNK